MSVGLELLRICMSAALGLLQTCAPDLQACRSGMLQSASNVTVGSPFTVSCLVQKSPVPTPSRIVYVYSFVLNTETTRAQPGPDPLRF